MNLVLNEKEWAKEKIERHELGRHPLETLNRVARYYRQADGYSRKETLDKLEKFLIQCDPDVNLVSWSNTLSRIVKQADKYTLAEVNGITVTKKELEAVGSVGNMSAQRLAFTLLCVAKYWNAVNADNCGWVNTADKEVLAMANVKTSIKRQCDLYHALREVGFIQFSRRVDNLNVRVIPIYDDEQVLYITDFRNLGNQYMMYLGEHYFPCQECGAVVKRNSPRQKYCPSCSSEIRLRQSAESVKRRRKRLALERQIANSELV